MQRICNNMAIGFSIFTHIFWYALADPGGAHPARAPPNGRGPMIFNAQKAYFSHFFLRSRLILNIILKEIGPKHALK